MSGGFPYVLSELSKRLLWYTNILPYTSQTSDRCRTISTQTGCVVSAGKAGTPPASGLGGEEEGEEEEEEGGEEEGEEEEGEEEEGEEEEGEWEWGVNLV